MATEVPAALASSTRTAAAADLPGPPTAVDVAGAGGSTPRREGAPSVARRAPGTTRVRRAGRDDLVTIDAMLRALALESPVFGAYRIADSKLATFLSQIIRSNDHVVLLHEGTNGVDALFIGALIQQFFTFDHTAVDIVFYVRPASRGSRAATRLFQDFKRWAEFRGAKEIRVGSMTGIEAGRTAKFYKGMGLSEVGGIYHAPLGPMSTLTGDR